MDYQFLQKTPLFSDSSIDEIKSMLNCLEAEKKKFAKGDVIYRAGDTVQSMGLVQIENDDLWGNKSVLDSIAPGMVFAETYAFLPGEPLMVSAVASEPSEILFLNGARILQSCPNACIHHSKLIRRLLTISSQKNLNLSRRIFHTSAKTIRGRLVSYLSGQAAQSQSPDFTIPFNRQQLADYLSVDRSALSNELGKMQRDGLLQVNKNHFILKEKE